MKQPAKEAVGMFTANDLSPDCDCVADRPQLRPRGIVWLELMTSELDDEESQDGELQDQQGERG